MSPKGPPLSFLLFCYRMRVYKSKRVPLLHFSALCDIFRKNFFSKISSFFPKKMFCAFWALDIAPTWDVPVLFTLTYIGSYGTKKCKYSMQTLKTKMVPQKVHQRKQTGSRNSCYLVDMAQIDQVSQPEITYVQIKVKRDENTESQCIKFIQLRRRCVNKNGCQ